MSAANNLPLDTRDTVRDKEIEEREAYKGRESGYSKGIFTKSIDNANTKKRLDLFKELFEKLEKTPKKKAEKLSKIVLENDLEKSAVHTHELKTYKGRVVPYTNLGMIAKLLNKVLLGFQMKGKLNKVGNLFPSDLLRDPVVSMKIVKRLMGFLQTNVPGADSIVVLDNYMKLAVPVIQEITGKLIGKK